MIINEKMTVDITAAKNNATLDRYLLSTGINKNWLTYKSVLIFLNVYDTF